MSPTYCDGMFNTFLLISMTAGDCADLSIRSALIMTCSTHFLCHPAGFGLESILPAVIERVPQPPGNTAGPLRMLLFDAFHDEYRGVICLVEIVDGHLRKGDRVVASSTAEAYEILEVV